MSNIVWTIVLILTALVYLGISLFRYKEIKKKWKIGERTKKIIFFWIRRLIVVYTFMIFLFFTFNEYILFCKNKMLLFYVFLVAVVVLEFSYGNYSEFWEEFDADEGLFIPAIIAVVIVAVALVVGGLALNSAPTHIQYLDDKITIAEVLTYSEDSDYGKKFGIYESYKDAEKTYSLYYISKENGKKAVLEEFYESQLADDIEILEEGSKPYIEIVTKQFVNIEEKEKKVKDGEKTYKLHAPLSAFRGSKKNNKKK